MTIAIALAYAIPPVLGLAFAVHVVEVLSTHQLVLVLNAAIVPVYVLGSLAAAIVYFYRFLQPVVDLADGKLELDEVFPLMKTFMWRYWVLYLGRHLFGAVLIIYTLQVKMAMNFSQNEWARLLALAIPVSVLSGLQGYVYIVDRFAEASGNATLKEPLLRVRVRVFLIAVMVPVLLNSVILLFLMSRLGGITVQLVLVYVVLTAFSIAAAYSLMVSLERSVKELKNIPGDLKRGRDLRLRTMDEFGVLTCEYRTLLEDLEGQATLLRMRNEVLQASNYTSDPARVYGKLLGVISSCLESHRAELIAVNPARKNCEFLAVYGIVRIQDLDVSETLLAAISSPEPVFLTPEEIGEKAATWSRALVVPLLESSDSKEKVAFLAYLDEEEQVSEYSFSLLQSIRDEISSVVHSTRIEIENEQLEMMLLESQRMEVVGRLAAGVAHDFNNILTVVVAAADILLDEVDEGEGGNLEPIVREQANMIMESSNRAVALTRQLLTFSKQKMSSVKVFSINEVIVGIDKFLRRILTGNIEFVVCLGKGQQCVQADRGHIEQILTNLIVNAQDAMPEGGGLVLKTWQEPGAVFLRVSDEGTGMTEEVKAHIFEPFYTTKTREKGTGLGLATVYGIVKNAGGSISVESKVGEGTSFTIRFPSVAPAGRRKDTVELPSTSSVEAKSILLAEDDDAVRKMVSMALRRKGYRVVEACDGSEAVEILQEAEECFDLLLSDVIMPGKKGTEVAACMMEHSPGTSILLMTGFADVDVLQEAQKRGFPVLDKPFTPKKLIAEVNALLQPERLDMSTD